MSRGLGYLATRSARNRLLRQLRRLRTPRYAIALVLGLAYLWAVGVWQRPSSDPSQPTAATLELVGAMAVTAMALWSWIFGADRRTLAFTRAEVTWLFPAPLVRRQLIQYKLLRGQFVILFNVVLWTFLLSRGWAGAAPWLRAGAIWVLLTTLALHRLGVALLRSSLVEHGRAAVRVRALTLGAIGLVLTVVAIDAASAMPALRAGWESGLGEFLRAVRDVAGRPVPDAVLRPGRWLIRPLLAETWATWATALLPAIGLLLAHFVWVVRSDAAFEEAAAAAALARSAGSRHRNRAARFLPRRIPDLAPTGAPGGALLWKSLASVVRTGQIRNALLGFGIATAAIVGLAITGGAGTLLEITGWLAALWAAFLLVLGPQWVRNDLRTDLSRLAVLRSLPVRGRTVVGAETAGSTTVLTALQLGLVGVAYLAFWGGEVEEPSPELRTAILAGAVILLPAVNFLAMLIQNGTALLFPAWVRIGQDRPIGVEALGHNMLAMSGFLVVLAVLLLLPAAAGAAVVLGFEGEPRWWAVAPGALAAFGVAALEAHLLLGPLGRVFEATDPSAVAPVESG